MTSFLASVATISEMNLIRSVGPDIIDLKDPSRGALGAWPVKSLRQAMHRWQMWEGEKPEISATAGDQPMDIAVLVPAVRDVASTGVGIVKIGLFPEGDVMSCLDALALLARETRLVAVFLADRRPDFDLLEPLAAAGFFGAMVDTADKEGGGLRKHLPATALEAFVARARRLGLMSGLAGSLTIEDIPPLVTIGPDYLGFRGALCAAGRSGALDLDKAQRVRRRIDLNVLRQDKKLPLPSSIGIADEAAGAG